MNRDIDRRIRALEAFYAPIDWNHADQLSLALRGIKQADLMQIAAEIDGGIPKNTESCRMGGDFA